jgi:2-polyprenyl-3-methyl-5-hydroxy-6-metoxy-1,4-benzoquinol methylase
MKLLSENELIWSSVVANSAMNRGRNASGINSYEKEFKFKPQTFLKNYIEKHGQVRWLDLCCGQGKALVQVATDLAAQGLQHKAVLSGIDLIDSFLPIPPSVTCVHFEIKSAVEWLTGNEYDLITCAHGLHYIGDKLQVLKTAFASLSPNGLFIANLDLKSILIGNGDAKNHIKTILKKNAVQYNARTRIVQCSGYRAIDFVVEYKGANDQAGPNYTGQEAVNSFYEIKR